MNRKMKVGKISVALAICSCLALSPFQNIVLNNNAMAAVNTADELSKVDYSKDVIYQIVTDRYYDGDSSNNPSGDMYDSTKTDMKKYFGGDWQGIIDKINDGYLTGMGVTALWISQPVENIYSVLTGGTSYHGYWARDFKKTNPAFGSFSDFQRLVDTAHENGMKVIIDFAPNHTSPADDTDESFAENGRLYDDGVLLGGYTNDTNNLFYHNGGTDFSTLEDGIYKNLYDLADLNHQNDTVDTYFKEAIDLWLDMDIDGIRMDAVKHISYGWQKSFMDSVYSYEPVFTFGEWFLGTNEIDENNSNFANNNGMSLLDFRYAQTVREVLKDETDNMYGLNEMFVSTDEDYENVNDQVIFIDNHDMERFAEGIDKNSVDLALVLTLTSRGVPAIYYGTEQYMTGGSDPENRAMMTDFNTNTNAYQIIKSLSDLRETNSAIGFGTTEERWINDDVYVYERSFGDDVVLVAVNRGDSTTSISGLLTSLPDGSYTDVLGGKVSGNSITVNNGAVTSFNLAGNAAAVWSYNTNTTTPNIGNVVQPMAKAGEEVLVTGEGFGENTGKVYFDSVEAQVVSWTDENIKVIVPEGVVGKIDVSLESASGVESNVFENYDVVTDDLVTVRFVVNNAETSWGESLYLVGNVYELGNWNPDNAVGTMYNQVLYQYPTWYYDVSVPAGTNLEFKFIKKNGSTVTWESGSNHTFTVPTDSNGTVTVDWQN